MAFDQSTRGRLQKVVNYCRILLSDEFSIQLQQIYGLDPKTGEVTPMARLTHLDDRQRHTAEVLRQTLAHYLGADADDPNHRIAVLDRMVREQAFTVLNRLAALLMMEARGQLIESVSKGYQSRGYQLYSKIAGMALGETGQAYQVYLFSVFDELAQELSALFDRYAANGLLFPRETALRALLDELNHFEIEPLWGADETIGWIYQYFNSKEERKAMRDASQAPRSSRELAVRNQFFTPRYVVEFLVDNTLGRFWFNATGGRTKLREHCQYLLVKSDEQLQTATKIRDPRTLKLLDPACGSMHFGLYAFDLFLEIYNEAWAWEQQNGPGSLDVSTQPQARLKPLCQTYANEDDYLREVPRLIIENNIYGVDIDPRAAQIATLALWLRAQRAWHDAGVNAKNRPGIGQGHVLAAVAPPAERELQLQFASQLDQRDAELFEKTLQLLKGLPELGVLLKIECELPYLIRQIYGEHGPIFKETDIEQWDNAETRLRIALTDFSRTARVSYQGRLFAQDALQGLRMIDLTREKFDVVVMNPPFGLATKERFEQLKKDYPDAYVDLYACFVSRAIELCTGWVGAISSRSLLITKKLERLRANWVVPRLERLLDLGWPVMDDATVQSAAYTLNCTKAGPQNSIVAIDRKPYSNKAEQLASITSRIDSASDCYVVDRAIIARIPRAKILYNLPSSAMHLFLEVDHLGGEVLLAKQGMKTFNDFRFLRLRAEVSPYQIGKDLRWVPIAKGGAYANFYSDLPLLVNWTNDGQEISEVNRIANGQTAQARQASIHYFKPGGTYSYRSKDFGVRALPADFIISGKGIAVLPLNDFSAEFCVGLMNARLFRTLINLQANAKQYDSGIVESCPFIPLSKDNKKLVEEVSKCAIDAIRKISQSTEGDALFVRPEILDSLSEMVQHAESRANDARQTLASSLAEIDRLVDLVYQVDSESLENIVLAEKGDDDEAEVSELIVNEAEEEDEEPTAPMRTANEVAGELVSYAVGAALGRWDIRYATAERPLPALGNHFAPLPGHFPGLLRDEYGPETAGAYPLSLPQFGVLADVEGHRSDLVERVQRVFKLLWRDKADDIEQEIVESLGVASLREYLRKPSGFFAEHLALYTKSKRKAPIYWSLATASNSYTLWVYYPTLSNQTLFKAVNDFLDGPNGKLTQVSRECAELRMKGGSRSRDEEKLYETLQIFDQELTDLRDTLLKIAPAYQPNQDDGVQISAAPLWQLFRHKPWQKVLKDTWTKLEKGDYDWSHLAMAYWPDRVRQKCKIDKSLAIAHGMEMLYIEPEGKPKKIRAKKNTGDTE